MLKFECAVCEEDCASDRPENEINAEAVAVYGVSPADEPGAFDYVCGECWRKHVPAEFKFTKH